MSMDPMRMAYMILWAGLGVTSRAWASSAGAQEWSAMRVVSVDSISPVRAKETIRLELEYVRAPVENPLKGLVPYAGEHGDRFPHTLEFNYLPLSDLVHGEETYDWTVLESLLNDISSRGHQAVFRVYLEYPGKKKGIPEYLVKGGLKVQRYTNTNTQPFPPTESATPDYSNQDLRRCLRNFITELGRRYDGDHRIGFITAGLLGTWGEWHTYPRNDLWAGKEVQSEVLDAYEAAFKVTPILLRYPAGEGHYAQAPNARRRFGYHDDSFAWATLDTGRKGDEWFFLTSMKAAGPAAIEKWKQYPIGGEIRPEAWGKVFDEKPEGSQIQDIGQCVKETHATWLMDSGIFREKTWTKARRRRAEELVRNMGYEFHVPSVTWTWKGLSLIVEVEIENRGIAPFYYDWPVEFALLSTKGSVVRRVSGKGKLTGILLGDRPRVWKESFDLLGIVPGSYQLALRVPNPLPNGIPLRFANQTQDQHAPGWLTLTPIPWREALAPSPDSREDGAGILAGDFRWTAGSPVLQAKHAGGEDWISVKDPSIVRYNDRWHLFFTVRGRQRSHAIVYLSFSEWDLAQKAEWNVLQCHSGYFCAPQVFYFAPHKRWYFICQASDESWSPPYQAAYSTTTDISAPDSWSPLRPLGAGPADGKAGLDFWIICDEAKAHLFLTTLDGRMWREETVLKDFPTGWSAPVLAIQGDIFEASHTYRLKGLDAYLTLVEAQNGHGWRYYKAYAADRLDGPWRPIAADKDKAFASMKNVRQTGDRWTDSISHGELIRSGHDQHLEVNPTDLRFLIQGVTEQDRQGKEYGAIPWHLGILESQR